MEDDKRIENSDYTAFISYRRVGGEGLARLLFEKLKQRGVTVFYDVDSLRNGRFDINLLNSIDDCDNFILILSKNSLSMKRIRNRKDFVRREIEHALKRHKNIVPILLDGFEWPPARWLPKSMRTLPLYNGINMHSAYSGKLFDAFVEQLIDMLVKPGEAFVPPEDDFVGSVSPIFPWKRAALIVGICAAIAGTAALWLTGGSGKTPRQEIVPDLRTMYVYSDADAGNDLYRWPMKIDGANGGTSVEIDMKSTADPHSGATCICCQTQLETGKWGGWMLLNGYSPGNGSAKVLNDGETPNQGEDLSGMTELRFYARGEKGGEKVEFFCCGFGYDGNNVPQNKYNDSAFKQSVGVVTLSEKWKEYSIPLDGDLNLGNISCGIGFVCNGGEDRFYIDDVRYCGKLVN